MGTSKKPSPQTADLIGLLLKRYEETQGWLLFWEVANGTGYKGTGYADALAMSLWPSRGISLHGFEIKRTRTDLIKELRNPKKADNFQKYCSYWWLVVHDAKLVDGVVIPDTWGVLAPRSGVLCAVKPAPKLEPESWKPEFIAALMRRYWEQHLKQEYQKIENIVDERVRAAAPKLADDLLKQEINRLKGELEREQHRHKLLKDSISRFQEKSGLKVDDWRAGDIGAIAQVLLDANGGYERKALKQRMEHSRRTIDAMGKAIRMAMIGLARLDTADRIPGRTDSGED